MIHPECFYPVAFVVANGLPAATVQRINSHRKVDLRQPLHFN